ncbi:TSUP family transporter [Piscibacillus salipiscarius]|uniref:TSUP family transporter n=1 Tax=Piscibacillus salipiscarius TaxID=299480 RepID=UPI0034E22948
MEFILIYFIGVLATTLGTLAGGGGLISLPSMLALGVPVHSAIGANKVSNTISSLQGFLLVYRQKGVTIKEGLKIIPISLAGGVTGGLIAASLTPDMMYQVALILLVVAFIFRLLESQTLRAKRHFM